MKRSTKGKEERDSKRHKKSNNVFDLVQKHNRMIQKFKSMLAFEFPCQYTSSPQFPWDSKCWPWWIPPAHRFIVRLETTTCDRLPRGFAHGNRFGITNCDRLRHLLEGEYKPFIFYETREETRTKDCGDPSCEECALSSDYDCDSDYEGSSVNFCARRQAHKIGIGSEGKIKVFYFFTSRRVQRAVELKTLTLCLHASKDVLARQLYNSDLINKIGEFL